jgi:hypothetical protein
MISSGILNVNAPRVWRRKKLSDLFNRDQVLVLRLFTH